MQHILSASSPQGQSAAADGHGCACSKRWRGLFGDAEAEGPQLSEDWRAFRAQLVAQERHTPEVLSTTASSRGGRWVHELSAPEVGCLLVARYEDMGIFSKSVILLLAHNDVEGTLGLILNRPTPLTLDGTRLEAPWIKGVLGEERLYLGGPVNLNRVNMIHGCKSLTGTKEVVEGVYYGGDLTPAIETTEGKSTIHIFMGYAAWSEHQLAAELHDNSWWVLAASKDVILGGVRGVDPMDKEYYSRYWDDVIQLSGLKHTL